MDHRWYYSTHLYYQHIINTTLAWRGTGESIDFNQPRALINIWISNSNYYTDGGRWGEYFKPIQFVYHYGSKSILIWLYPKMWSMMIWISPVLISMSSLFLLERQMCTLIVLKFSVSSICTSSKSILISLYPKMWSMMIWISPVLISMWKCAHWYYSSLVYVSIVLYDGGLFLHQWNLYT